MKRKVLIALGALLLMPALADANEAVDKADKEWRAYLEPLMPIGARVAEVFPQANDPRLRQEMLRMLYSELGAGFLHLAYASPEYPDFIPNWGQVFNNIGNLNPDAVYAFTQLEDDGVYKISGYRGTVRIVDFQIGDSPTFAYGKANKQKTFGPTFANYDIDTLTIGKDGAFEFILSARRPKDYAGDWRQLPPKTNYMVVRQLSYDWLHEVDARLAIERLDRPAQKPRQTAAQIKAALDQVPEWTERSVKMSIGPNEGKGDWAKLWGSNDKIVMIDFTHDQGGRATQLYISGKFELGADQAMIVEFAPGKCRYWNIHLGNELLNTLDFMNHQIGLNGFTAKPDSDGRYRFVIAAKDPGVPNWLDNMDYRKGYIWGRLDTCEDNAAPSIRKVNVAEVRKFLPADTPVVNAETRDASIRLRRKGAQLRQRW